MSLWIMVVLWNGISDRMVAGAKVVRCRVVDVVVGRKLHIDSRDLSKAALLRAAPHYEEAIRSMAEWLREGSLGLQEQAPNRRGET